jgi:Protein of unknown function (DUF1761)
MFLNVSDVNAAATLTGGLMYMIYGGIYYSLLLGKKKDAGSKGPLKYVFSVIAAFISSFLVGVLVQAVGADGLMSGLAIGLIIGLLISLVYCKNTLFGLMTKQSCMIAIGDHLVIFILLGLLHGIMD